MYKRYISWENGMEVFTYLDLVATYEKEIDKIVLCGPPTHNGNASFGLFLSKILNFH